VKFIFFIFILYSSLNSQTRPVDIVFESYYGDTTITDTIIGPAYKGKWIKMGDKTILDGPFTRYAKSKGGTPPFVPDVTILPGTDRTVKD
jgi:hypothetical protein